MRKKPTAIPVSCLISGKEIDQPAPLKAGESGTVLYLHETELQRLRWQLSLPTCPPEVRRILETEIDRLALAGVSAEKQRCAAGKAGGSKPKINITAAYIQELRDKFILNKGYEHGWKTWAAKELGVTVKTLNSKYKQ